MNEKIQAKDEAIRVVGGFASLAEKMTPEAGAEEKQRLAWAIAKWYRGVPSHWVLRVEMATGISRHLLRPDLYPKEAD